MRKCVFSGLPVGFAVGALAACLGAFAGVFEGLRRRNFASIARGIGAHVLSTSISSGMSTLASAAPVSSACSVNTVTVQPRLWRASASFSTRRAPMARDGVK